jgi:hypothetical protein
MMQALQAPKRYRGFLLTAAGWQKLQATVQYLEAQTQVRQNARTIAERVQLMTPEGIHPMTVRKILQCRQGVDKRSIEQVFEALNLTLAEGDCVHASLHQEMLDPSDLLKVIHPVNQTVEPSKTVVFSDSAQIVAVIETADGYCMIVSKLPTL